MILKAARELFLEQGFEATTTKQICERADVSEPLLFTNFGSKVDLFRSAVLSPIDDWVATYAESFRSSASGPEERTVAFVEGLFTMAQENRTVLLSALAHRLGRRDDGPDVLDSLAGTLQGLTGVTELARYGADDPSATTASALGMVLGVALMGDLLFAPGSERPTAERLVAEIERFILYGTTRRDPEPDVSRP